MNCFQYCEGQENESHDCGTRRKFGWSALVLTLLIVGCASQPESTTSSEPVDLAAASCLGPADADHFAVYLHGMDVPERSSAERVVRGQLERIGRALNMRIALPRAPKSCPTSPHQRCWMWYEWDRAEVEGKLRSAISDGIASCFPDQERVGLIGFSNGALIINRITQQCLDIERSWQVTVGNPGGWTQHDPADLSGCPSNTMLMGRDDIHHYEHGKKLATRLRERGADIRFIEFDGGHEVPEELLQKTIAELMNPNERPR